MKSPYGRNSDILVYPSYSCSYHKIEHKFSLTLPLPLSATKGRNKELECLFFFLGHLPQGRSDLAFCLRVSF